MRMTRPRRIPLSWSIQIKKLTDEKNMTGVFAFLQVSAREVRRGHREQHLAEVREGARATGAYGRHHHGQAFAILIFGLFVTPHSGKEHLTS